MKKGKVLPLFHAVNDLEAEGSIATLSKVAAQLTGLIVDLLPVPSVPDVHVVDGLAHILHVALLADHQVHTVF